VLAAASRPAPVRSPRTGGRRTPPGRGCPGPGRPRRRRRARPRCRRWWPRPSARDHPLPPGLVVAGAGPASPTRQKPASGSEEQKAAGPPDRRGAEAAGQPGAPLSGVPLLKRAELARCVPNSAPIPGPSPQKSSSLTRGGAAPRGRQKPVHHRASRPYSPTLAASLMSGTGVSSRARPTPRRRPTIVGGEGVHPARMSAWSC